MKPDALNLHYHPKTNPISLEDVLAQATQRYRERVEARLAELRKEAEYLDWLADGAGLAPPDVPRF